MGVPSNRLDAMNDPSAKAGAVLEYVLNDEPKIEEVVTDLKPQSAIEEELTKKPLVASAASARSQSRVLFITQDVSVLIEGSLQQLHYKNLSTIFDEIHIIVLCESWQARRDVVRLEKNMWAYSTAARFWWLQPFVVEDIARSQLQFTDGFRPDCIIALDPFEAGICGMLLASYYKREFQVHVCEDFLLPEFKKKLPENRRKVFMASIVLRRSRSVRVSTLVLKNTLAKKFAHIKDLALLPRQYDVKSIIAATENLPAGDLFPQFTLVVLFVGVLDHESTLFRAMDACRTILQSPKVALVVVGDGPAKKEFQKRAEILGIRKQVLFESDTAKTIPYMQSSDIFICSDTTEASEEVVISAAAVGIPLLLAKTALRNDLFVDGESGFLCDKEDTIDFFHKLGKFVNESSLRTQFATNAKDVIKTRLHEDPEAYKLAYRDTIEGIFIVDSPEKKSSK